MRFLAQNLIPDEKQIKKKTNYFFYVTFVNNEFRFERNVITTANAFSIQKNLLLVGVII